MTKKTRAKKHLSPAFRGLLQLFIALAMLISLISFAHGEPRHNALGIAGYLIGWVAFYLLGLCCFFIPFFLGWQGICHLRKQPPQHPRLQISYFAALVFSCATLLSMLAQHLPKLASLFTRYIYSAYYPKSDLFNASLRYYLGGVPLYHLYRDTPLNWHSLLGEMGTFCLFFILLLVTLSQLTPFSLTWIYNLAKQGWQNLFKKRATEPQLVPVATASALMDFPLSPPIRDDPLKKTAKVHLVEEKKMPPPPRVSTSGTYTLPPASLLTEIVPVDQSQLKSNLKKQAEVLEETLLSFGIEAKVGEIHCGPTITSFEVHPAFGVKVQKIKTLENDIALNMQAKSIRIIAPIPGKAAVGIEVPNPFPQEVSFRQLLENYRGKAHIPLLLGKMVNGEDVWTDLTKMPHLIIAGATGSGKSVCINTIVMSILMTATPDEIKLVMVDPKKVELTAYTHLPHMLAPVITEPAGALAALNWLTKEMELRYEIFRQLGIRNIHGFNTRKVNKELEHSLDLAIPDKMPFIVVIIDELADLMLVSSSDIETPIARIAQMARAVGIHLILATQRPSREVITGLIKANFPTRIAFKVSSRINSQIIIDENGAESLLGNGDMLFMPPGSSSLTRAQGAFIRDEDINQVIHHICSQAKTHYIIPNFDTYRDPAEVNNQSEPQARDSLYDEAKTLVLETGTASTTFLQRKLKVGYARAASLMDQLEQQGVIGPSEGAKPRKIFYPEEGA